MAGLLRLSPTQKAALSNWVEPVDDKAAAVVNKSMGSRYDGSKLVQSLQTKVECISALRLGCEHCGSFDVTYNELSAHLPDKDELAKHWIHVGKGLEVEANSAGDVESALDFPLKPRPAKVAKTEQLPLVDEVSESLSSPSSDLDSSDLWDISTAKVIEEHCNNQWVASTSGRGKLALIHTVTDETDGKYLAACGRKLKLSSERFTGWHTVLTIPYDFCPNCLERLPAELGATLAL